MKTVLILGAGAVRAVAPKNGPPPPLDADFFQITRRIYPKWFPGFRNSLSGPIGDYAKVVLSSLEATTTHLFLRALDSTSGSRDHKLFLLHLQNIVDVLSDTTNRINVGPRSLGYRLFRTLLLNTEQPADFSVVTFNYDLFAERVLDSINGHHKLDLFSFPECYGLPPSRLLTPVTGSPEFSHTKTGYSGISTHKLHGSVNWVSTHTSDTPSPSALFNVRRDLHILNSVSIHKSLTWRKRRGGRTVYVKPIIVPPITGKKSYLHIDLDRVWKSAAASIREADRVVVFGYSCPDLDVEARIMLSESMRLGPPKEFVMIDPDTNVASKYSTLCGPSRIEIFRDLDAYLAHARS